jgi:hypothetical protein
MREIFNVQCAVKSINLYLSCKKFKDNNNLAATSFGGRLSLAAPLKHVTRECLIHYIKALSSFVGSCNGMHRFPLSYPGKNITAPDAAVQGEALSLFRRQA